MDEREKVPIGALPHLLPYFLLKDLGEGIPGCLTRTIGLGFFAGALVGAGYFAHDYLDSPNSEPTEVRKVEDRNSDGLQDLLLIGSTKEKVFYNCGNKNFREDPSYCAD